jgi:hypothetical protein
VAGARKDRDVNGLTSSLPLLAPGGGGRRVLTADSKSGDFHVDNRMIPEAEEGSRAIRPPSMPGCPIRLDGTVIVPLGRSSLAWAF